MPHLLPPIYIILSGTEEDSTPLSKRLPPIDIINSSHILVLDMFEELNNIVPTPSAPTPSPIHPCILYRLQKRSLTSVVCPPSDYYHRTITVPSRRSG